jgi:hypothetical protein
VALGIEHSAPARTESVAFVLGRLDHDGSRGDCPLEAVVGVVDHQVHPCGPWLERLAIGDRRTDHHDPCTRAKLDVDDLAAGALGTEELLQPEGSFQPVDGRRDVSVQDDRYNVRSRPRLS